MVSCPFYETCYIFWGNEVMTGNAFSKLISTDWVNMRYMLGQTQDEECVHSSQTLFAHYRNFPAQGNQIVLSTPLESQLAPRWYFLNQIDKH